MSSEKQILVDCLFIIAYSSSIHTEEPTNVVCAICRVARPAKLAWE